MSLLFSAYDSMWAYFCIRKVTLSTKPHLTTVHILPGFPSTLNVVQEVTKQPLNRNLLADIWGTLK